MVIKQLFQEDINRKINGVVKVDQNATEVLVQELDEYVITKDLLTTMERPSKSRRPISVFGFPASSEVVNLTF